MDHHLKTHPEYFKAIKGGIKRFEYRYNDRGYEVGDVLVLHEWIPWPTLPGLGHYTGRHVYTKVTYIYFLPDNNCILSIDYMSCNAETAKLNNILRNN